MRYSEEQIQKLYEKLGGRSQYSFEITVINEIIIDRIVLDSILYDRYNVACSKGISTLLCIGPTEESYENLSMYVMDERRLGILNTFVNIIKFKKVPLYINKIPEIARWRLQIGV